MKKFVLAYYSKDDFDHEAGRGRKYWMAPTGPPGSTKCKDEAKQYSESEMESVLEELKTHKLDWLFFESAD